MTGGRTPHYTTSTIYTEDDMSYTTHTITKENPGVTDDGFDIDPKVQGKDREAMLALLRSRPEAFANPKGSKPAPAPGVKHTIRLTDPTPIKQSAYRHTPEKQAIIVEALREMKESGTVRESNSAWSSPIVLVQKPHQPGKWRVCIDYRKLNARTKKDAYPVPVTEDCLNACSKGRWFTLIDVRDAFHHVEWMRTAS